ncbi:DUF3397 domain-containing protein [Peribacillus saganii]|uniref:DUF3397 domain-containing protein n=1 Tax=Peribacillus saganii TaxID=2303992 RepID=A0A372LTE3_9BACI|nr:DUF3397 domain-containing protein [Peribacillus saganii]RFU71167.1 DUF3397 domain-containing protein [Peribacillus saganii]
MTTVFSWLAATFVTIPLLGYIVFFIIAKQITKNHRRSVHLSMDFSTLLFIISVHYLIQAIWGHSLIWLLLLIMLAVASTVVIAHYKVKQEIIIRKVFKGFWRVNFLLFFCIYFCLVIYGMISRISQVLLA